MAMALPTAHLCSQVRMVSFPAHTKTVRISNRRSGLVSLKASAESGEEEPAESAEEIVPGTEDTQNVAESSESSESSSSSLTSGIYSGSLSKKDKVALKSAGKQILSLRFLWMEKNIGIALDQVVPGHGTIPLSPFYFWPKKDAWEELKAKLESKPWISKRKTIILLNQATDIINLWQQKAGSF